jgi:hypothetical protein
VVSLLEKGNRRTLVVVNRDFAKALPVRVAFDGSKEIREVRKDRSTVPITGKECMRELTPGDVLILEWDVSPAR